MVSATLTALVNPLLKTPEIEKGKFTAKRFFSFVVFFLKHRQKFKKYTY
jgi:hypothetical protein